MADQLTVTEADLDALAAKLEAMSEQFDHDEIAALHALFALAGDAIADHAEGEVEGFGLVEPDRNAQPGFGLTMPGGQIGTQGVLIGLLRTGGSSNAGFQFRGGFAMGDGSV